MSENTNVIPAPSTPEEAQALIDSLREEFNLDLQIAEFEMRRAVQNAIIYRRQRRESEVDTAFAVRHLESLASSMMNPAGLLRSNVTALINSIVRNDTEAAASNAMERLGEAGWTAEILVKPEGREPEVVYERKAEEDDAHSAELRALEVALELEPPAGSSVSVRLALPSAAIVIEDNLS